MTTSISSASTATTTSSPASTNLAAVSSPGIGSGLNVNSIVSALMSVEQVPLTQLQTTATSYQADISAFSQVQGAMSALQIASQALADPTQYQSLSATVGNTNLFSATAGSQALPGSYSVEVKTLAQSQKLVSTGFTSTTSAVGTGTLAIQFGTYDSTGNTFTPNSSLPGGTVTIGAGNNTLAGIRDAINAASIGVTATIINDGSAAGNRLVITSNSSGVASSVRVQVTDADGNNTDTSGLSQLAYDPTAAAGAGKNLSQTVAAQDATLNIDGIAVSKPSNTITDAIQGVTLNLATATPGSPTTLTLSRNTSNIQSLLSSFVSAYNTLNTTMSTLTAYNASTQTGGQLLGDPTAQGIEVRIRSVLAQSLPSGGLSTLAQVGVGFQKDGSLALDSNQLSTAISANPNDIAGLFAAAGTPSDSQVSFVSSTSATKAGSYGVNVTQMATQGSAQGSVAAGTTITAGVNDTLNLSVDGVAATITLAPGTYTAATLAQQLQTQINGNATLVAGGVSVAVSQNAGVLNITSQSYGSASSVSPSGGNALSSLLGTPVASAGVDVAGTINGIPASGSGQTLTGAKGSSVEGLIVQITGGTTGTRGTVNFTRGFADQLDTLFNGYLGSNGILQNSTDNLNTLVTQNQQQQTDLNNHLASVQAAYMAQFTALDTMIASMNTTSSFLTQQFDAMAGTTPTSSSSSKSSG